MAANAAQWSLDGSGTNAFACRPGLGAASLGRT